MVNKLRVLVFLFFISSMAYGQALRFEGNKLKKALPNWVKVNLHKVKLDKSLVAIHYIHPLCLSADFNGDGFEDIAILVKEKIAHKKGILIIHGNTFEGVVLGAGKAFGNGGDDFKWMEIWKLNDQKEVGLTTFSDNGDILGSENISVKNISIEIAPNEGPSNLITFSHNKYIWLHTGD